MGNLQSELGGITTGKKAQGHWDLQPPRMGRDGGQSRMDTHWVGWTRSKEDGRMCGPGFRGVKIGSGLEWVDREIR